MREDEKERRDETARAGNEPTFAVPVFAETIKIAESDVDVWGHANNVCYVRWMQDVAVGHSAAVGWPAERYLRYGAIWVVRRHTVEYRRSAYRDQTLVAQTWIGEMKNVSCVRKYRFFLVPDDLAAKLVGANGGAGGPAGFAELEGVEIPKSTIVATAETVWGFVSTKDLRPERVALPLRDAFGRLVQEGGKIPET